MSTTVALDDLLRPSVVLGRYSRNRIQFCTLAEELGIAPNRVVSTDSDGGKDAALTTSNSVELVARAGTYDIYDRPTDGAAVVPPGQPAQIIAENPVGNVNYRVARLHPSIILHWDRLNVRREIGGNAAQIDSMGAVYVTEQLQTLGLKVLTSLEIMTIGMMRDSLYLIPTSVPNAFNLDIVSTNNVAQIKYQVPAGNLTTMTTLCPGGLSDWSNSSTGTPITDCNKINAGFAGTTGRPLRKVIVNSIVWNQLTLTTEVRNAAGSANSPFATYDYVDGPMPDGMVRTVKKAVLKGLPGVEWVINDEQVTINGSLVKKIEDKKAFFCTDVEGVFKLGYYNEPISEQEGSLPTKKQAISFWKQYKANPSGVQCFALGNLLPLGLIPKCWGYGTVTS